MDADSDEDSFISVDYVDEESSSTSQISPGDMVQVDNSVVIANNDSLENGGEGCPTVS
jgi:hypothetical protein